jgi:hypothetical protein
VLADHELLSDLGYHSLALTELVYVLQDLFSAYEIAMDSIVAVRSVGDLTDLIERALADGTAKLPSAEAVQGFFDEYELGQAADITHSA